MFADPDALQRLNAIVHPLVGERLAALAAAAAEDAVLLYDVPLIAENKMAKGFDVVVVVDVPPDVQLDRLVRFRGMPEADARARMAHQATREERLAIADIVYILGRGRVAWAGEPSELRASPVLRKTYLGGAA